MTKYRVLLFIILASIGIYFYSQPPSQKSIVRNTTTDPVYGFIKHDDVVYIATWDEETSYSGDVRHIGKAFYNRMPIFTHDVILTTGEFSDPERVKIDPVKKGQTRWRARKKPQGTLTMLHIIPENVEVLAQLEDITLWDKVELIGREEEDHFIQRSDGRQLKVNQAHGHVLFLLMDVKRLEK